LTFELCADGAGLIPNEEGSAPKEALGTAVTMTKVSARVSA